MNDTALPNGIPPVRGRRIEIRIQGRLDAGWSDWLDGLAVEPQASGETLLSGEIRDQAELLGILNRLNGLNLTLLSVNEAGGAPPENPRKEIRR